MNRKIKNILCFLITPVTAITCGGILIAINLGTQAADKNFRSSIYPDKYQKYSIIPIISKTNEIESLKEIKLVNGKYSLSLIDSNEFNQVFYEILLTALGNTNEFKKTISQYTILVKHHYFNANSVNVDCN
jgi:hypothetical protein